MTVKYMDGSVDSYHDWTDSGEEGVWLMKSTDKSDTFRGYAKVADGQCVTVELFEEGGEEFESSGKSYYLRQNKRFSQDEIMACYRSIKLQD